MEQDKLLLEEERVEMVRVVPPDSGLTARETQILLLVSRGKTNAEIADVLSLSPRTVKKHLEHIYRKLRVHTRGSAVAHAFRLED